MMIEALEELAIEAENAGDAPVAIILYVLLGTLRSGDDHLLYLLAKTMQVFARMAKKRLENK